MKKTYTPLCLISTLLSLDSATAVSATDAGTIISLENEEITTVHDNLTADICQDDAHCFNGGTCQMPTVVTTHRHCHCPPGYSGTRCARYCPFSCHNGGICTPKVGPHAERGEELSAFRPGSSFGKSFVNEAEHLKDSYYEYDKELYHCKCKGLFTGALCEIPFVNCNGKNHRCYHGGTCVFEVGDDGSEVVGCDCPEGYGGVSCENKFVSAVSQDDTKTENAASKMARGGIVALTLVMLSALLVGMIFQRRKSNRTAHFENNQETWFMMSEYREDDNNEAISTRPSSLAGLAETLTL
jgi:hypothetical protein